MSSPAERFAAARDRSRHPVLTGFTAGYPFELDEFQTQACRALEAGDSVLVCAPTGSGKTVVGEFATELALGRGQKCFYTTPIKALSNQKYNDLVQRHGAQQVGLLTGDNAINAEAPVVVMTTEVLRNMLYSGSPALRGLGYVVMDEVHYLGDRFRGAVWEEVIIHLSEDVRLVSLSATVSNAEEFGEWLNSVRGRTAVVVHEQRPVPLWQHMLVGRRMFDLFTGDGTTIDPALVRYVRERQRVDLMAGARAPRGRTARPPRGWRPPHRPDVLAALDRDGLLPAITFVFSRAGCDAAVRQCVDAGLWLTDPGEREEITAVAEQHTAGIASADLDVLGYWDWLDGLRRGLAAHHAGMIPVFKQAVEQLFVRGLVRAVFATETLALGINMPARCVVLERLTKFNGESHADITPGEYTQLTGRAGRRGIDVEGHAVVLWSPEIDPNRVAGLASTRTYPLRSSFRPSYNMAVNLVAQVGRADARTLLESSFAQFQADRSVAGLANQLRRNENRAAQERARAVCERGDITEYLQLRRALSDEEADRSRSASRARREAVLASLVALRPGDVVRVAKGKRAGLAVVLDAGVQPRDEPRPLVVTEARWSGRLSMVDFGAPVEVLGQVRIPRGLNHRSPQERRDLVSSLHALDLPPAPRRPARSDRTDRAGEQRIVELRAALRAHPCHSCPDLDEHVRWARRAERLDAEDDGLRRRMEGRTASLGRVFDRICGLLESRGFLLADVPGQLQVPEAGQRLARIWSESDLLVAECLQADLWAGLDAPELAAVVAALVYEPRRDERVVDAFPTVAVRDALQGTVRAWAELADAETAAGLQRSREPDPGFVWPIFRWARGDSLDRVLATGTRAEVPAGDFVRWCRQVIDLLDQIAAAAPAGSALRRTARRATDALRHGIVARSMLG